MELAVGEVNARGGVLGRKLELIVRNDNGNAGDAVRLADELIGREKVDVLTGSMLSHIGLALSDFARQRRMFFLASEALTDRLVWESGNRYTFRLRTSTYMQVSMLVQEAAKLGKRRWALIYPNYEYGRSAVTTFKAQLKAAQPNVEFVSEQAFPLGKLDAGPVVEAIAAARPDAIFNATFASDLARFVREGNTRGLFKGRSVVSLLTGEPEYLDPLKDEAPEGWIVTGYPWYGIDTPEHNRFTTAYRNRYGDYPRLGSVIGYATIEAIVAGVAKAKSTDTEQLIAAFRGLTFDTPLGKVTFRSSDHQSTLGAYVGVLVKEGGAGRMRSFVYKDGAAHLPPESDVRRLRPADSGPP